MRRYSGVDSIFDRTINKSVATALLPRFFLEQVSKIDRFKRARFEDDQARALKADSSQNVLKKQKIGVRKQEACRRGAYIAVTKHRSTK
jgi:hypothetical protein